MSGRRAGGPASLLVAATVALACGSATESPGVSGAEPVRTDRSEYTLRTGGEMLEVEIPFTFTNTTGRTVAIVNCNGLYGLGLEREEAGGWVRAWSPAVPMCLSPPIELEPGESLADTVEVAAGRPGSRMHPQFEVDEVEGRYRLVIHNVVHDYDPDRQGFGEPVPLEARVSNTFRLERSD